jgi:hypothetical protein
VGSMQGIIICGVLMALTITVTNAGGWTRGAQITCCRRAPQYSLEGYFENSYNYAAVGQYSLGPAESWRLPTLSRGNFDHVTDMLASFDDRSPILLFRPHLLASARVAPLLGCFDVPTGGFCRVRCTMRCS